MRYRTIVADPPWPIRHLNKRFKVALDYPTMPVGKIANLPIGELAEDDAHLYLWTPDRFALEGAAAVVARHWGFEPARFIVWAKTGLGLGTFPRAEHELVLVCKRGRPPFQVRNVGSVQRWKLVYENGHRKHSAKPEGFFDLIERASPGPYLELFARRQRIGWDTWGDQCFQSVEIKT